MEEVQPRTGTGAAEEKGPLRDFVDATEVVEVADFTIELEGFGA